MPDDRLEEPSVDQNDGNQAAARPSRIELQQE